MKQINFYPLFNENIEYIKCKIQTSATWFESFVDENSLLTGKVLRLHVIKFYNGEFVDVKKKNKNWYQNKVAYYIWLTPKKMNVTANIVRIQVNENW